MRNMPLSTPLVGTGLTLQPEQTQGASAGAARPGWWLFSAPVDLAVFAGSALVALAAVAWGAAAGLLDQEAPDWAWVPAVLLIDVAHVYATGFRVYLDPGEWRRRPWLYSVVPGLGFVIGMALYTAGELIFWRILAYVAVFHFVRQQYGWVVLYRARLGERGRWGWRLDAAAIYLATLYPLLYWHAHLPRRFWWFLRNDFAALPPVLDRIAAPIYWGVLGLYALRAGLRWLEGRPNPGKDMVVATTAACWYVGIVALNSDYAFLMTNVIIHGVPYLALVYWYRFARRAAANRPYGQWLGGVAAFLATLWLGAYVEEMLWDRGVWHERGWLFGSPWELGSWKVVVVPLLALPQLTHYILDGFIWRRHSNPAFSLVTPKTQAPLVPDPLLERAH